MANNVIQVKRTSISGRAANTTTLPNPGELALNLADRIMYSTNGSFVFEIGANNTNAQVSNTLTIKAISSNGTTGNTGDVLTSNGTGTYWASLTSLGTNVAAQYIWTNTHTFSNTATFTGNVVVANSRVTDLMMASTFFLMGA